VDPREAQMAVVSASLSDIGRSRSDNQDALGELTSEAGERLWIVADGMGGHRGGAEASRLCIKVVERGFLQGSGSPERRLCAALEQANDEIYERALQEPELTGMGATAVAFLLTAEGTGWVAWVGDSRLYRLRAGRLEALTEDHSLVGEWLRMGVLTPQEAARHPKRNELTRAVGAMPDVDVDVRPVQVRPGDRFLLCSDGLNGAVPERTIGKLVASLPPEEAVRSLVAQANHSGGKDNITVQVIWIPGEPAPEPAAPALSAPAPPAAEPSQVSAAPDAQQRPAASPPQPLRPLSSAARPVSRRRSGRGGASPLLLGLAAAAVAAGAALWALAGPGWPGFRAGQTWTRALPPAPAPLVPEPAPATPPARAPERSSAAAPAPETEVVETPDPALAPVPAMLAPPGPLPAGARQLAPSPEAGATTRDAGPSAAARAAQESPSAALPAGAPPGPHASTSALPATLRAFVDALLRALSERDYPAFRALGFADGPAEFARRWGGSESWRLTAVETLPQAAAGGRTFVRLRLSYALYQDGVRFRTEDELRLILVETPAGLRYAGRWR
jgi:protein phosphatase